MGMVVWRFIGMEWGIDPEVGENATQSIARLRSQWFTHILTLILSSTQLRRIPTVPFFRLANWGLGSWEAFSRCHNQKRRGRIRTHDSLTTKPMCFPRFQVAWRVVTPQWNLGVCLTTRLAQCCSVPFQMYQWVHIFSAGHLFQVRQAE